MINCILDEKGFPVHCAEQILYYINEAGSLSVPDLEKKISFSATAIRNNMGKLRTLEMIDISHRNCRRVYFKISKTEQRRIALNEEHFLNHL